MEMHGDPTTPITFQQPHSVTANATLTWLCITLSPPQPALLHDSSKIVWDSPCRVGMG